jgi:hypothetical protein
MRKPYPDSPNAKTPLFALANGIDCRRLSFDRVIFLDIDGVLHPDSGDPAMQFCFVTNFFEALEAVRPQRDVPIVISSTWRMTSTMDAMREHFPHAMHHQIVGVTPDLDVSWEPRANANRQSEIQAWMRENSPSGQWLAIDDRAELFEIDCKNVFLVPQYRPGLGAGLNLQVSDELKQALRVFLKRPTRPEAKAGGSI